MNYTFIEVWMLSPFLYPFSYVSFGSESDGGYMDMSKDEPSLYVPMQEQTDTIKYADIQNSPYESPYQQDIYQEQGLTCALLLTNNPFSSDSVKIEPQNSTQ